MDGQRFAIGGRVYDADDASLQAVLEAAQDAPVRPRCLCVPQGVAMYVAFHRQYRVKRMPDTGHLHHPRCPSYAPEPGASGLGELIGEAILADGAERVALRVDFPLVSSPGRAVGRGEPGDRSDVGRAKRQMSLRGLLHFLFERAGFNRWSPAMAGRRNQAVIHKHLMRAAEGVQVKGEPLAGRLYVPEAFSESDREAQAQRRRARLAVLQPQDGRFPMAVLIGELKRWEPATAGARLWIRHMPDAPVLVDSGTWGRIQRTFASMFEAKDAEGGQRLKVLVIALVRARRELTLELDRASMVLTTEEWIPLEGVHEAPLIRALVEQGRRFVKPMRYDAKSAAVFANALLLDAGDRPVPLHLTSRFMPAADRDHKLRLHASEPGWLWDVGESPPELPPRRGPGRTAG